MRRGGNPVDDREQDVAGRGDLNLSADWTVHSSGRGTTSTRAGIVCAVAFLSISSRADLSQSTDLEPRVVLQADMLRAARTGTSAYRFDAVYGVVGEKASPMIPVSVKIRVTSEYRGEL